MKIAILGTRGVPNFHGGFEQFAEYFSIYLANNGCDVYVYNSHNHPFQESKFKGVNIIHCKDPENRIGTIGQFFYDLNCILDSRKRSFDIILQLGYTSSSIWNWLFPNKPIIITNMDGLEWKRSKYSKPVQKFLKYAEKIAVKSSNYLISDSRGIQKYLKIEYNTDSKYIAYGAELFKNPDQNVIMGFDVKAYGYNLLIARMEPENNIEVILDGVAASKSKQIFLVIGKHDINRYGAYLKKKYQTYENIRFIGGVYDIEKLNNLRYFSNLYFHGHSVGGTNPSLLEAMASRTLIVANENEFNKSILKNNAFYFKTPEDVTHYIETIEKLNYTEKVENCYNEIDNNFNWELINKKYLSFLDDCHQHDNRKF